MAHDNSMVSRGEFNQGLDQVSDRLHEMVDNQREMQKSIQDMILLAKLTQTAQIATDKKINDEISPRVNTMWDNQNKVKGGYATLATVLVVVSATAGFLAALVTIHHVP